MKIKFSVLGEPQGKARARTVTNKHTGFTHSYTPAKTVKYEKQIKAEYLMQTRSKRFPDGTMLDMRIVAYFGIPVSATKKNRELMLNLEMRPTKKPDMDNIVKVVSDALNKIAYSDDSQIVDCQVRKFYAEVPRVEVTLLAVQNRKDGPLFEAAQSNKPSALNNK